jgi:hypothetical protein
MLADARTIIVHYYGGRSSSQLATYDSNPNRTDALFSDDDLRGSPLFVSTTIQLVSIYSRALHTFLADENLSIDNPFLDYQVQPLPSNTFPALADTVPMSLRILAHLIAKH